MVFPMNFLLLFGICMLVSAIGFKTTFGSFPWATASPSRQKASQC